MGKVTSFFVAALIIVVGIGAARPAFAVTPIGGLGNALHVVIWVPDYYGRSVIYYTFNYAPNNGGHFFSQGALKLPASGSSGWCNPNAVTMQNNELYIVCNSTLGGVDEVLVYNTSTHQYKRITGIATDGHNYFAGSQLIAILLDSHGNLWVSGYGTNDLLRVPSNQLGQTTPKIDRQVNHSPDMPAGLAMDTDKSIWVVGQYAGGIVVNFPDDVLNKPGNYLGSTALNPTPSFCISNGASGCQDVPNLFNNPEGVAVFDKAIWVSNNGGNAPARTIVGLKKNKDVLTPATYGGNLSKPFACPGGMFALPAPSGGQGSLWVNDEGYDDPHTQQTCGATQSDRGSHVGRVLQFLADDLTQHESSPTPVQFTDWNQITTSSPGFGGIFVQAY